MKTAFDGLISKLDMPEKRISEPEDVARKSSKTKQREQKLEIKQTKDNDYKQNTTSRLWDNYKT